SRSPVVRMSTNSAETPIAASCARTLSACHCASGLPLVPIRNGFKVVSGSERLSRSGCMNRHSSMAFPIQAKQVPQRFEVLQFSAKIANAFQPFGGIEQHAIEQLLHERGDGAMIAGRKM